MKNKCDIVQDLLFGYKDNTLKQGSKELVEEHLKTCRNCKNVWEQLHKEENAEDNKKIEIDYLKNVKKKINKKNKIIIISSILLLLIIGLNIGIFTHYIKKAGNMDIYLNEEITKEQLDEITQEIHNIDKDAKIIYKTKQDVLNEMKERFKDSQNLLNGYEKNNNPFKPYIEVDSNIKGVKEIKEKLKSKSDLVKKITTITGTNPYMYVIYEILSMSNL
mgnify:FL=1